jgi:hypothetical protein
VNCFTYYWLGTGYQLPHTETVWIFSKMGDFIMFIKTSIALAIIVAALCSNALAAPRHDGNPQVLVNRCATGNWDPYGLRCEIEQ